MSELTREQLLEKLKAMGGTPAPAAMPAVPAWGQPVAPPPMPGAGAVLVPIEMDTPAGKVTLYASFGGEHFSPHGLMGLLESLMGAGLPVKAWKPKMENGGGGNGWQSRGGGGGGYGRPKW